MTRTAAAIAALLLGGCERTSPAPERPPPVTIFYAAKTENASSGANDNYFSIVEDHALFVVADAVAASPGADPAKRAADGLDKEYTACVGDPAPLACASLRVNRALVDAKAGTTALAAVAITGNDVTVSGFGDVVVVEIRDGSGELEALSPELLGTPGIHASARRTSAQVGDTFAILDRDLFAALGIASVVRFAAGPFRDKEAVEAAVTTMIETAKSVRDHGPLTVVLVHLGRK